MSTAHNRSRVLRTERYVTVPMVMFRAWESCAHTNLYISKAVAAPVEGYFECYATIPMLIAVVFTMISAIAIIDHHLDSKRYFLL